jgi:hypothetical protein
MALPVMVLCVLVQEIVDSLVPLVSEPAVL